MPIEMVFHNGVEMQADWPARIAEAQDTTVISIEGAVFPRIRYGNEADDWGAERTACHDCGAAKGQFHVPGCDVERCPKCGGQAITCNCQYDDE